MGNSAIHCEPLSKRYRIGARPTHSSLSPGQEQSKSIIWTALALVCLVYALPHLLAIAQTGKILPIFRIDDTIYMVRTAAAMRGDSLGNPYIAGHENAPFDTGEMAPPGMYR
jgi:hypothetical protein